MVRQPKTPVETPTPDGQVRSTRAGGRIQVVETWFDDEPASLKNVDVWICYRRSHPVSARGWLYFYTIHVDLTLAPETLLKKMRKRRAPN